MMEAVVASEVTSKVEGSAGLRPISVPARGPRVLTHSAMECWGRCETEYRLAYEDRIVPTTYPAALAVGSAVHAGVETLHLGLPMPEAYRSAAVALQRFLERALTGTTEETRADLEHQAEFDLARSRAMLNAWAERYLVPTDGAVQAADRDLEVLATERVLEAPLVNPLTGRASRSFVLSGKLDAIVRHRDDRYRHDPDGQDGWYVYELKSSGEHLGELVEAMTVSAQPAVYQVLAEASYGPDAGPLLGTILDVIRKPTIRPKKEETPLAYESRALEAYHAEPEAFFRRVVLPVDSQLRREVMVNAWRIADGIRRAERYGFLTKRGPACRGAYGPCRYRALCWHGDSTGYATKETAHEELADGA